ncbi:MAG: polysaccharide biosynthesis C-terminal domain-containing protein [Bacteroidota bacterium]
MGVIIKQSFWGTFIAYVGVIVGYVNTLYLRVEYFDFSQIGIFTLITAHAMMISPVSSFGMSSSYVRFFPSFEEKDKNKFFTFLFLITVVGNLLILLIGYSLREVIASRYVETAPQYISYLSIIGIIIVANSLFELFFSYSNTIKKVVFPSFLREVYLRLGSLSLVIGYAFNWWDFNSTIIGLGVVYSLAFLLLFTQLFLIHNFRFDFHFGLITKEWKLKLLKFGSYAMLMAGSFAIINNVSYDQITAALGSEINGIFNTCFYIAVIVEMPKRNMAKIMSPILSEEFSKGNMKEVGSLYKRSSITMSSIGLLLCIGIVTNLQDLFDFIPKGEELQIGFWVVIGVCLAKLAVMIFSFGGEVINFSHHYKYNLYFQIGAAILLVALNYFLIPLWGLNGAVISYFTTVFLHLIAKALFVMNHFKIHPFVKSHMYLLGIGAIVGSLAFWLQPDFHPILNIIIRSALTTIVFVIFIYRFNVSEDINKLIRMAFGMLGFKS